MKLYELSLQEYRFQVLLNWDRSKQMLVVDGVLLAAAAAVYRLAPARNPAIIGILFLLVALVSLLGFAGTKTGHEYYRATRNVKTEYERRLGLDKLGLALETTPGMKESHQPDAVPLRNAGRLLRRVGRLTFHLQFLFITAAIGGFIGAAFVLADYGK